MRYCFCFFEGFWKISLKLFEKIKGELFWRSFSKVFGGFPGLLELFLGSQKTTLP